MRIIFDKDTLGVEQNNYVTKTVNAIIVYDLNAWPKILLTISSLKIVCLERLI